MGGDIARPESGPTPLTRIQSPSLTASEAGNVFWPCASGRKRNRFSD